VAATAEPVIDDEDSDQPAQATPSTGESHDEHDFEMVDKSVDSLGKAKSTGAQGPSSGKKRRGRKK
jgi:hypothetical protein